jgi:sugar phosphate isomerase/epimerase
MTPQLALQLYTVRDALAQDFAGTLQRVATIGYRAVESAFLPEGMTYAEAAEQIRAAGLTVMAAHCELPLGDHQDAVLNQMATLGCQRLIWHGWPQDSDYSTVDGIKRLAARYNAANEIARAHGYTLGLHNHWWECEPVAGQLPYQILLAELDPTIFFELDTYWARTAGQDPAAMLSELGDRAPLIHIKDGPAVKGAVKQAVGDGIMDIAAIAKAATAAEYFIVELDDYAGGMLEAIERSYRYLTDHGFAQP